MKEALWIAFAGVVIVIVVVIRFAVRSERRLGTPTQRAALATLHTANLAAPALRTGLNKESAERSIPHLRQLIGTPGVALADTFGILAAEGIDAEHCALLEIPLQVAISRGRPHVLSPHDMVCANPGTCSLQAGIVVPITTDDVVVGAIVAVDSSAPASLLRLSGDVAEFVSTQLQLAELDRSRRRAVQFELRFLRAQISPHFIYNALTAIESFVRSDPDRARELLVQFADFIRYSFRSHGQFVTMAEELRLVDTYLDLERARFGDRLEVTLRVAPEVLSVMLPPFVLQPLVENAVHHGLEPSGRTGHLDITIMDADNDAEVCVEDDGVGAEPGQIRRALAGAGDEEGVGLHNVDERLRTVFGDESRLTIETAPGAGTRVTVRIPKYHVGVLS
ncbi:MAG TPA: histidine kinase [Acidimicrobiales bacterium]|jgi:two-component system LytT family sensor kinase|nr:histidine kinase [Acidimicrobiales bacterium]